MNLSLMRITSVFPHFNERAVTTDDFWRVAKRERIIVKEIPLLIDGYYQRRRGRHYILINSKLSGVRWLHTALHELHHYFFDEPGRGAGYAFYRNGQYVDRREYKADAFATICLLPWPELLKITPEDVENNPDLADLVAARITIRTHFGL